MKDLYKCFS